MKVLEIIPDLPLAGAERMAETLSLGLAKKGIDVRVVSLYQKDTAITDNLRKNGVKVIFLNKKPGMDISMIFKLTRLFKREKPNVIHTHRHVCQYVIPAAGAAGVSARVHTVHSIAEKESTGLLRLLQSVFFKRFSVVPAAINDAVRDSICSCYKLPREKVPVIYNGIDLSSYKKKIGYNRGERFRILHIGRFMQEKNHENLIKAFETVVKNHKDIELHFIGDGVLMDNIKNMVHDAKLDGRVIFHGLVSVVRDKICEYDGFVLPSLYEGMPMTIIEAMAAGMPIAASAVGGIPDMITDNVNGLLCTPEADSIAAAIEKLYTDAPLRERLGRNAARSAEKFSVERMTEGYIRLFEDVTR